jgi:hypothetical protein
MSKNMHSNVGSTAPSVAYGMHTASPISHFTQATYLQPTAHNSLACLGPTHATYKPMTSCNRGTSSHATTRWSHANCEQPIIKPALQPCSCTVSLHVAMLTCTGDHHRDSRRGTTARQHACWSMAAGNSLSHHTVYRPHCMHRAPLYMVCHDHGFTCQQGHWHVHMQTSGHSFCNLIRGRDRLADQFQVLPKLHSQACLKVPVNVAVHEPHAWVVGPESQSFGGAQLGCFDGSLPTDSKATRSSSPGFVLGEPTVVLSQQTMHVV